MKTRDHSILPSTESCRGKFATHRLRFGAACGSFFVGLVLLTVPPSVARAECSNWDVSGSWDIKQSNGFTVRLNLTQTGNRINGSGKTSTAGRHGLHGNIHGDDFYIEITWGPDAQGVYRGKIGSQGRIDGTTYDAKNPGSKANWFSSTAMKCADAAAVKPTPQPNSGIGKMLPTTPTPAGMGRPGAQPTPMQTPESDGFTANPGAGEAGKSTRPYIRALPQIVSIPSGQNEALTKLVWFAGNDHPNAQLVVEVDGGDEHPVDSQRKGSRQVKVKAGKSYKYTLSDAGEPLASVVVQSDQSTRPDLGRLRGERRESRQDAESEKDDNPGED